MKEVKYVNKDQKVNKAPDFDKMHVKGSQKNNRKKTAKHILGWFENRTKLWRLNWYATGERTTKHHLGNPTTFIVAWIKELADAIEKSKKTKV